MAITINNKLGPYDYVLNSECKITFDENGNVVSREPKEGATVFNLQPLNGFEKLAVGNEIVRTEDGRLLMRAEGARKAIAAGLRGWRSMRDKDGKDVPYSHDVVEQLDHNDLNELAWEIAGNAHMPDEEIKN